MKRDNLSDQLARHYAGKAPTDASVDRLVQMATSGEQTEARRDGPQPSAVVSSRGFGSGGRAGDGLARRVRLAAAVGITLVATGAAGFWLGVRSNRPAVSLDEPMAHHGPADSPERHKPSANGVPRLVALRVHADWCPRSPAIGPIYTRFVEDYGNESIIFATVDITDDATKKQSAYLLSELGIDWLVTLPGIPGRIMLLDRDSRSQVAILTDPKQAPELREKLAHALLTADKRG